MLGGFCPLPWRLNNDPISGWAASQHARVCADLTAAAFASSLAIIHVETTGNTIDWYNSRYGVGLSYVPNFVYTPGAVPSYEFTWETSYQDSYERQHLIKILGAVVRIENGTRVRGVWTIPEPRSLIVELYNIDGNPITLDGFTILIN